MFVKMSVSDFNDPYVFTGSDEEETQYVRSIWGSKYTHVFDRGGSGKKIRGTKYNSNGRSCRGRSRTEPRDGGSAMRLNNAQVSTLECAFVQHPYPSVRTQLQLMAVTGLSTKTIHMWFVDRRVNGAKRVIDSVSKYRIRNNLQCMQHFNDISNAGTCRTCERPAYRDTNKGAQITAAPGEYTGMVKQHPVTNVPTVPTDCSQANHSSPISQGDTSVAQQQQQQQPTPCLTPPPSLLPILSISPVEGRPENQACQSAEPPIGRVPLTHYARSHAQQRDPPPYPPQRDPPPYDSHLMISAQHRVLHARPSPTNPTGHSPRPAGGISTRSPLTLQQQDGVADERNAVLNCDKHDQFGAHSDPTYDEYGEPPFSVPEQDGRQPLRSPHGVNLTKTAEQVVPSGAHDSLKNAMVSLYNLSQGLHNNPLPNIRDATQGLHVPLIYSLSQPNRVVNDQTMPSASGSKQNSSKSVEPDLGDTIQGPDCPFIPSHENISQRAPLLAEHFLHGSTQITSSSTPLPNYLNHTLNLPMTPVARSEGSDVINTNFNEEMRRYFHDIDTGRAVPFVSRFTLNEQNYRVPGRGHSTTNDKPIYVADEENETERQCRSLHSMLDGAYILLDPLYNNRQKTIQFTDQAARSMNNHPANGYTPTRVIGDEMPGMPQNHIDPICPSPADNQERRAGLVDDRVVLLQYYKDTPE